MQGASGLHGRPAGLHLRCDYFSFSIDLKGNFILVFGAPEGMILMALTRNAAGVIIFSWTAGIMYSTLFTMPYLLVANYHACQVV